MVKNTIKKLKKNLESTEIIDWALDELKRNIKESNLLYSHSLRVALILKEIETTEETIACGMLHHVPIEQLTKGNEEIIHLLKKMKQLREIFNLKQDLQQKPIEEWQAVVHSSQAENLRKMFFALTEDLRPVFAILAAVLDEMRHINHFSKEERAKRSIEALEIFAPLAYSMGITTIKGELEDLAFPQIYFKEYQEIQEKMKDKYKERETLLKQIKPDVRKALEESNIPVLDIHARAKHHFSLYKKLLRHDMDINSIHDLIALRIIVPDIQNCYKALGAIHKSFKPLSGRIKDYIATPKRNGYRSLHTTVICNCKQNQIVEIQIRTPQMHKEAEYGAAYHLGYKQSSLGQSYWMNQLREWKQDIKEGEHLKDYLKSEIFKDRIFVLTPKREIIDLPKGSTPIDFAYAVHTEIGEHCEGAKVNGKIVSLKKSLKTGEIVEIITNKNKVPSSDWLRFIKTNKAKNRVKFFLEKAKGISFKRPSVKKPKIINPISLLKRIVPKKKKTSQVYIAGQSGISIKMSKCCQPKEGDNIEAFITKGEGASLHKTNCSNLKELKEKHPERILKATWQKN